MGDREAGAQSEAGGTLLALYERAVPQVYGYLLPRCGSTAVAEELLAETFLAAVEAIQRQSVEVVTIAWLIGIARHKLADDWRRRDRELRHLAAVNSGSEPDDPWEDQIHVVAAHEALARLRPVYRAALTLRYLDGLSVADVASHLGRTLHATETLLLRAKAAFRQAYGEVGAE